MSKELLKRAVQELDSFWFAFDEEGKESPTYALIKEIEAELAKPDPEPVAWKDQTYGNLHHVDYGGSIPLYAEPIDQSALITELEQQLIDLQTIRGRCTLVPTDKLEAMQRKLKPLTDDEISKLATELDLWSDDAIAFAKAIENAHGISS